MIDVYCDDMTLEKISIEHNENNLIFRNKKKDESLKMPVKNKELLNIYLAVHSRCEWLGLIDTKGRLTDKGEEVHNNE